MGGPSGVRLRLEPGAHRWFARPINSIIPRSAAMDEQPSPAREPKTSGKRGARSLDRQRHRAEELLAAQKARLAQIETVVAAELDAIATIVAAEVGADQGADDQLRQQAQALSR